MEEIEGDGVPRRCDRLKDKDDMRVEDLAKEMAAAKDNYGNSLDRSSSMFLCYT
jgi:hypothetical protein